MFIAALMNKMNTQLQTEIANLYPEAFLIIKRTAC